jgi:hypothetical protein
MTLETYATLLNLKVIVPSSRASYVAVEKHYWQSAFEVRLSEIDVDETWYLAQNPDVASALEKRVIRDARQHYCQSGYFEHRMPYKIEVQPEWYMTQYPDVREAVKQGAFVSAQDHFEKLGYQEGRHPYPEFALRKRRAAARN